MEDRRATRNLNDSRAKVLYRSAEGGYMEDCRTTRGICRDFLEENRKQSHKRNELGDALQRKATYFTRKEPRSTRKTSTS